MPTKKQNAPKEQTSESSPILSFDAPENWEHWLEQNHDISNGIWLRFYKKGSQVKSVNYREALDVALCYGWIDGQAKSYDDKSYLQKFTPRRPKSIWSKRNIEHVTRLEQDGKMKPAGLKQIELAKVDGRWAVAYDSPANMTVPEDFLRELSINKETMAFFESLNKANKYAITWRLQTAKKPETREKRMKAILEMLARREKFHG
jgi:uncharacterized protein YdeI (YjbR/CyaY-like superfamily)